MYKLEIKLKQHTPLIHFQHDQLGATLRASEVKPKLDRFVLTKLGNGNYETGTIIAKEKGWLVGKGDHPALNYKMRIESSGQVVEYLLASYINDDNIDELRRNSINAISNTSFFAQEEQNRKIIRSRQPLREWNKIEKKGVLEKKEIIVSILLKEKDLKDEITKHIQSFFIANNYGTRQSKGFGCFSPTSIMADNEPIQLDTVDNILKQHFTFVYKKRVGQTDISSILSTINKDYKLLKSGLTRPYAKSKLLLYSNYLSNDVGWDKKYIKVNTNDQFQDKEGNNYILKCRESNIHSSYLEKDSYKYYRALLGLAEQFEFLLENPPLGDNRNKMIIKVKNKDIQRFQSPLLYKVYDNVIYLVGNEITPEILNKPFLFTIKFQNDSEYDDEPVDPEGNPIYTPEKFSLRDFISFAMADTTNGVTLGYETVKR